MFSGDIALKRIEVLSGGEKCRTLLGKLLATPANLLLLDEPTHHLDMQSCEAMMDAISGFNGAVLMVTHNEHILHRTANKLIVFQNDKVFFFHGTYSQFLDQIGWEDQDESSIKRINHQANKGKSTKTLNKKDKRKVRAEFIARRSEILTPYEKKIKELEKQIENTEQQFHTDTQSLIKASQEQDGAAIATLSKSIKQTRTYIDNLYEELEKTSEKYELHKLEFEERGVQKAVTLIFVLVRIICGVGIQNIIDMSCGSNDFCVFHSHQ